MADGAQAGGAGAAKSRPADASPTGSKGERTRRRILEAARGVFATRGYERGTIRAIAATAGVDKSSVIQYFGSKQNLFRETVHWEIPVRRIVADDPRTTATNLASGMFTAWTADPNSPMMVLLRASMTSEEAAELLRAHVTAQFTDALAAVIGGPDARLRAALLGAVLMGVASQRYLLRIPDLRDMDTEEILRLLVPALETLLVAPVR